MHACACCVYGPHLDKGTCYLFLAHSPCRLLHVNAAQEMAKVGARVKLKYPGADSVGHYDSVGQRGAIPVLQVGIGYTSQSPLPQFTLIFKIIIHFLGLFRTSFMDRRVMRDRKVG